MDERKFIRLKKEEFGIKEYIRRDLGKGKISKLNIEYTPVGEKIIILTSKPGLVIGRKGEKIKELTEVLKKRFKLENPHIEINEIENSLLDAQIVADDIALALERMGNLKFKVIAYKKLREIMNAGALGCELRLTGKLPSERARSWRFAEGYLKKAGDSSREVDRAKVPGLTKTGIIGVKVAIMPPHAKIYDKIDINDEIKALIKGKALEKVRDTEEKLKEKTKGKKEDKDREGEAKSKKDRAVMKIKPAVGEESKVEAREEKAEEKKNKSENENINFKNSENFGATKSINKKDLVNKDKKLNKDKEK